MIADLDAATRLAATALTHYGPPRSSEIGFIKYRENYVFRVEQGAGVYALRLHRHGYRSDDELLEELEMLTALKTVGIAVPGIRPTSDGRAFCQVADDDGDVHQIDMLEWVDGAAPLGDIGDAFTGVAAVEPDTFRALGRLVAELHTAATAVRQQDATPSRRPAWDSSGLAGDRCVWGDPRRAFNDGAPGREDIDQAMTILLGQLSAYQALPGRYGPIHADFTPENVLVGDGHMTLIDFDDSGDGFYLFDLATAAFFYLPHPRVAEAVEALLDGYREVRALHQDDLDMWRSMLLARGLTYLGWAADRPGDETSDFIYAEIRPLVVRLAQKYVKASR